jgi:integrase
VAFRVSITKQDRKRKLLSGRTIVQTRYFVNYREPKTGERKVPSFERQKDAEAFRNKLIADIQNGTYSDPRKAPTIAEIIDHFATLKRGQVRARTVTGYEAVYPMITGPLLAGTSAERNWHTRTGVLPPGTRLLPMLGKVRVTELTTADIRQWHNTVEEQVSLYTANRAKMLLKAALDFAAEDFNFRPPAMPAQLGRGHVKKKKQILSLEQVSVLLEAARKDPHQGVYYAFPFLAGTRLSEQLGLLWEDVDFDANLVRIRHTQEEDGTIVEMTKSTAGARDVPMASLLRELLLAWKVACPRIKGNLYRVFPGQGVIQAWPKPRQGGGGPLWQQNFRNRIWHPALERNGLPPVSPHSARHSFISTLQAQGIEVGLVAKLAGHASAVVTLSHYTQAVRGGEAAVVALERAFTSPPSASPAVEEQHVAG